MTRYLRPMDSPSRPCLYRKCDSALDRTETRDQRFVRRESAMLRKYHLVIVTTLREMLTMTTMRTLCAIILSASSIIPAIAQQPAVPAPQPGTISGTVTDV